MTQQKGGSERLSFVVLALIVALSSLLAYLNFTNGHNWGDDFAEYITQAKGIVEGSPQEAVAFNVFTNRHSSRPLGPDAAPWGYSLFLAVIYYFRGLDLWAMKAANTLFYGLFLIACYLLFRPRLSRPVALIAVALPAFNPTMLIFQDNVLSDIPFLAVSTLTLLLIDAVISRRRTLASPILDAALVGFCVYGAVMIRTQGVALAPVLLVAQITAGRTGETPEASGARSSWMVRLLPYAVFALLYLVSTLSLPSGDRSYLSVMSGFTVSAVGQNLLYCASLPADGFDWVPLGPIIYGCTLPFCLAGLAARGRHDAPLIAYCLFTLCLVIPWPDRQGVRLLFPLIPAYVYFACHGLMTARCFLAPRAEAAGQRLAYLCLAALAIVCLAESVQAGSRNILARRQVPGPFDADSVDMFHAVSSFTEPDSILIFFKPRAMSLLSGRRTIMIDDPAQIDRGNYLVWHAHQTMSSYNQLSPEALAATVSAGRLQVLYEKGAFTLYRVISADRRP